MIFLSTQFLREINFGESKSSTTTVFAYFEGLKFCKFGKFQPSKIAKFHKEQNSEAVNVSKWQILHFKNPQIQFHVKSE